MVKNCYQEAFWKGLAKMGFAQKGDVYVRGTVGDSVVFSTDKLVESDYYIGFKSKAAIEDHNYDWLDAERLLEEGAFLFGVVDDEITNTYNDFLLNIDELITILLEKKLIVKIN